MPNLQLAPRRPRIVRRVGLGDVDLTPYLTPPKPSHFPTPLNDVQAAAQADLQLAEKGIQKNMPSDLEALAQQNGDIAAARAAYDQYGAKAVNAFHAIVSIAEGSCNGQVSCFSQFSPVISLALAPLIAAVPAAGIAVAAALAVMDVIAGLVVLKPPECDWKLPGGACVTGKRPSGPADPTWTGWEQFMNGAKTTQADQVISYYSRTIACELPALQQGSFFSTGIGPFFLAYYKALQRAGEYGINGYQMPNYGDTLAATLNTWNAVHGPPAVALIETPGWKGSNGNCLSGGPPNDPSGSSFIGSLLAGDVDNLHWFSKLIKQGQSAPMVNIGNSAISQLLTLNAGITPPSSRAASSSTASTLLTGTAVVAGLGLAGAGVYSYMTKTPYLTVLQRAWQKSGGRVVGAVRRRI